MNKIVNYQAFIEKKNILTINDLLIDINNYNKSNDNIVGTINIKGHVFVDDLDNLEELNEVLNFSIDINSNIQDLQIENLNYQVIEARGIEIEFDFNVILNENRCLNDEEIKTEIVEEINNRLDEEFFVDESYEKEEVLIEEVKKDDTLNGGLPKTSRIVFRFYKDETGKRTSRRC